MIRLASLAALAIGLTLVPVAGADPPPPPAPTVSSTVISGNSGSNGWYVSDVVVRFSISGEYTTPPCADAVINTDGPHTVTCTATGPGGTGSSGPTIRLDKTPPSITGASPDRPADKNGWYNHALSVAFAGSDATSGIASCTTAPYSGPDSGSGGVSGTCRDVAGNVSAAGSFALKYDATAPSASATAARAADANGWYNHAVSVGFAGTDGGSGVDSCAPAVTYGGPDTSSITVSGSCVDNAGNSSGASLTLKYDATPPTASASPDREPDGNGWYTKPVAVAFAGSDGLSGLAGCDAAKTYSGPDSGGATVAGSCRDNAGNEAAASDSLKYDSTAPKLSAVAVTVAAGDAKLRWKQPDDTAAVAVVRSPGRGGARTSTVYDGRGSSFRDGSLLTGVAYRYTLTSRDAAGNSAVAEVKAIALALYAPAPGARAAVGTKLEWAAAPKASYYNVQLFRGGHKVLTTWTTKPELRLPRQWQLEGKAVRLTSGRYRWYVWPGHGKLAARHYGKLLGSSTFVVR